MRFFIALTYYRPHYSGLTIYVERLARALSERGHTVTVLTSRYDQGLPVHEIIDGVEIFRLGVVLHISKGVIMPTMPLWAWKLAKQADVVNLHVPQLDAALIAIMSRLLHKPVILTYHCDLKLPRGFVHQIANQVSHLANHASALSSHVIITNTRDYAENSSFLRRYIKKTQIILPPVELPSITNDDILSFRRKFDIQSNERVIGMASRLASEKGVEYLVQTMPDILRAHPKARVIFVGQYLNVMGEESYAAKLRPLLEKLGEHWKFIGILPAREFAAFLHVADVTVLPSSNSTESFGMVQIESMICNTPVVATDLPGVRQPILTTGMGKIVPIADPKALGEAIISILNQPELYRGDKRKLLMIYSPSRIAEEYESTSLQLLEIKNRPAIGQIR